MPPGPPSKKEYQQIVDRLESIEQKVSGLQSGRVTGLLSAVVATTDAGIDGQVTLADIIVSAVGAMGITFCGVPAGAGCALLWNDAGMFGSTLGIFALGGSGYFLARTLLDAFDPLGNFSWIQEFRSFRGQYQEFLDWLNGTEKPRQIVRPVPVHSANKSAVADVPEPEPPPMIEIAGETANRKARIIPRERLLEYVRWAFTHGWTRDKGVEWGLGQTEWADIRTYVQKYDKPGSPIWGTNHRPTLMRWLYEMQDVN